MTTPERWWRGLDVAFVEALPSALVRYWTGTT